jgi:CRISPR-associated endoribonuclease Cas6
MKIILEFNCEKEINIIPYSYNYMVYGFINNLIKDSKYDNHDDKTSGKYTFNVVFNNATNFNGRLKFENKFTIIISSHSNDFIYNIRNQISFNKEYFLGDIKFTLNNLNISELDYTNKSEFNLRLITPCIIRRNDKKCISPTEDDALNILKNNISKKIDNRKFEIKIQKYQKTIRKIVELKNGGKYTAYLFNIYLKFDNYKDAERIIESGIGYGTQFGFGGLKILNYN